MPAEAGGKPMSMTMRRIRRRDSCLQFNRHPHRNRVFRSIAQPKKREVAADRALYRGGGSLYNAARIAQVRGRIARKVAPWIRQFNLA
jgi:hypothetical protein